MRTLWSEGGMSERYLDWLTLPASPAVFASSFRVGLAAQTSIAAAALAAAAIHHRRTAQSQHVTVARDAAERECSGLFTLNGQPPDAWEPFSGLYATVDGHVRVHANFTHHRDGVLRLLNLPPAGLCTRDALADALRTRSAAAFENDAANAGLVVAAVRDFAEWDAHPHALANRDTPLFSLTRIGDAPPLPWPTRTARPLSGIRVLDLTRILAGPVCGRTLAAHGADVLLINAPHLPNISAIVDTSRGKRSALLDLRLETDRARLSTLLTATDIFVQGYRPGALHAFGLAPSQLARLRPGIVSVSLNAWGARGPWSARRGFDSLVQTATGFNHAEAQAFGAAAPRALPFQALDFASGFLMAFASQAALLRQRSEGGSWHVEVSLLATANWLRRLGRQTPENPLPKTGLAAALQPWDCDSGELRAMPHAADLSLTPAHWTAASVRPGTHQPDWE